MNGTKKLRRGRERERRFAAHLTDRESSPRHEYLFIFFTGIRMVEVVMKPGTENVSYRFRQVSPSPPASRIRCIPRHSDVRRRGGLCAWGIIGFTVALNTRERDIAGSFVGCSLIIVRKGCVISGSERLRTS